MASLPPKDGRSPFDQLLEQARAGSREALGHLLEPFFYVLRHRAHNQMRRALRSKCGGSDMAQMTLLDAHVAFAGFRGHTPEELAAWFWSILWHNEQNFCRMYLDSGIRLVGREVSLDDRRLARRLRAPLAAKEALPDDVAARREQDEALRRAIKRLPLLTRRIVGLHGYWGLPFPEVGAALGCSEEAVCKTFSRARRRLRRELHTAHGESE